MAIIAGTKVSDSTNAATKAMIKDRKIGKLWIENDDGK